MIANKIEFSLLTVFSTKLSTDSPVCFLNRASMYLVTSGSFIQLTYSSLTSLGEVSRKKILSVSTNWFLFLTLEELFLKKLVELSDTASFFSHLLNKHFGSFSLYKSYHLQIHPLLLKVYIWEIMKFKV